MRTHWRITSRAGHEMGTWDASTAVTAVRMMDREARASEMSTYTTSPAYWRETAAQGEPAFFVEKVSR